MKAHTLLTYRNLEELRRIQEKQEVFPFAFGDTKKQIKASPKITIGQHRINAKNRIIQWVPNKNCE